MPRSIMYIGAKALKVDNKTPNPARVWHGLGDTVENVPEVESLKLLEHKDIWMDVTNVSEDAVRKIIEARQEQFRQQQRRSIKSDMKQMLSTMSDDELMAEMDRRTAVRGRAQKTGKETPRIPSPRHNPQSLANEGDAVERPDNMTDVAADVIGAIMSLDRDTGIDTNGVPYPEKVREKVGYHVTDVEVLAIFKSMQGSK